MKYIVFHDDISRRVEFIFYIKKGKCMTQSNIISCFILILLNQRLFTNFMKYFFLKISTVEFFLIKTKIMVKLLPPSICRLHYSWTCVCFFKIVFFVNCVNTDIKFTTFVQFFQCKIFRLLNRMYNFKLIFLYTFLCITSTAKLYSGTLRTLIIIIYIHIINYPTFSNDVASKYQRRIYNIT